ncbi:WXG100 family type VII secretion target, partial [Janibacter sp. RAF20_2_2]
MNHPLLGDPASVSALGATLRRTALELTAHADRVRATLDDASPGWTGPRAVATRQRVDRVAASAAASAATLDECARSLQQ